MSEIDNDTCFASTWVHPGFFGGFRVLIFLAFFATYCYFGFVCLRPVSCLPNVTSVSGLYILDCPIRFSITFI